MDLLFSCYTFAIGAVIGSFLNVVIHRYPLAESVVFPPSRCPQCRTHIHWYDNIPIVSWLVLRGRCRACGAHITMRYPLVELSNALFYLAVYLHTGISLAFIPIAVMVSMLIALIYIDAGIQILPDVIDVPGIVIGLAIGALGLGVLEPSLVLSESLADAALGAFIGGGSIAVIILTYWLIRRVEGMGWGDAKMMAMLGAMMGWRAAIATLLLASVSGAIVGVPLALRSSRGMQYALPFGIFLGLAGLAILFFGHTLTSWYLALMLR